MDYKKKYLKYKKKYLESKNIIKNRITEEIKNNTNIKNKLKGGMSGDTITYIVAAVLSALGVGAGYLGYKHFIEDNKDNEETKKILEIEQKSVEEPISAAIESAAIEPAAIKPAAIESAAIEPAAIKPAAIEPKVSPAPAEESKSAEISPSEEEQELTRTFTAPDKTPLGVKPGPGGPRDKQKQEDVITMTEKELNEKKGFKDPSEMGKEERSALEASIRKEKKEKEIEEQDQKTVSGYY